MDDIANVAQLISGGGVIAFAAAVLMETRATRKVLEAIQTMLATNQTTIIEKLTRLEERTPKPVRWRTPPMGIPIMTREGEAGNDDNE